MNVSTMNVVMRRLCILVALTAFAPVAHAQSKEALDLAGRLFESSGLAKQLEPLGGQFDEGLAQNRGKLPDEVLAALSGAGKKIYTVAALREQIVPLIARKLPAADIKQTLEWLDGPIGRRMTLAEERASAQMTQESMQAYLEGRKSKPADPKRDRLVADLITATNSVELAALFVESMTLGVAMGMDAVQPVEKRVGLATLRARMKELMPPDKLRANLNASFPVMYGFTYRDIGDADLAAYVKFNGSALGKRYNQAVVDALNEALTHASVRIGELMQSAPARKRT